MTPIFCRMTKIDELTQTVHGRAVQEVVDRDSEIFDYCSSKPNFQKWSAEIFSESGGKSYGNVRSMHGPVAAGKITEIQFLDDEKAIDISAKIVDPVEFDKCLQGVHLGFSIGGRYSRKWSEIQNGKMVTKYTAVPNEVSLVDRPCVPTAKFFQIHKMNGRIVNRQFKSAEAPMNFKKLRKFLDQNPFAGLTPDQTMRKIHSMGGQRIVVGGASAVLTKGTAGNLKVGESDLRAIVMQASIRKKLKKLRNPPESSNAMSGGAIGRTGAQGRFRDDPAPGDRVTVYLGQVRGNMAGAPRVTAQLVSDGRIAMLQAVKDALAGQAKVWGVMGSEA